MRKLLCCLVFAVGCQAAPGGDGAAGTQGPPGPAGAPGKDGASASAPGSTAKAGSRIRVQWTTSTKTVATEDGASIETVSVGTPQFFDSMLDVACAIGIAEDGAKRCLPSSIPISYFEDSSCTKPIAYQGKDYTPPCGAPPRPAPPPSRYWRQQAAPRKSECDPVQNDKHWILGAEISPPATLYGYQGTPTCKPLSADLDGQVRAQIARYFTVAAMSPAEFVRMTDETKTAPMP